MCDIALQKRPAIWNNISKRWQRTASYVKFHLLGNLDHDPVLLKNLYKMNIFYISEAHEYKLIYFIYTHVHYMKTRDEDQMKKAYIKSAQTRR